MKKAVSVILALIMLAGIFTFSLNVSAYSEKEPTGEELGAGFTFDVVYVIIKDEYKFREFTAEDFGSDLIDRIEIPYPITPEDEWADDEDFWLEIHVYLKENEMTKKNITELCRTLSKNEYVKKIFLNYTGYEFPVFPETPEEIGVFSGAYRPYTEPEHEGYDRNGAGMLNNPYYKKYYNGLLNHSYSVYNQFAPYMGDIEYVDWFIDTYLEKEVSYITVILAYPEDLPDIEGAMKEYNIGIIKEHLSEENIMYVADTVPAVVLRVTPEDRNALRKIDDIVFIGDAFFTSKMGGSGLAESGVYTLGNVTGRQNEYYEGEKVGSVKFVNAADARLVLRFAAGLEKPETELKRFYYCADMNFDGEINSADARLCLRTAAGLEKEYDLTFGYKSSWYDPMG
ncbi:MAG: hypothetical protein IJ289_00965 [Clostridia bacterium]|nr:hypothetical protein [Clostridia bacterium]